MFTHKRSVLLTILALVVAGALVVGGASGTGLFAQEEPTPMPSSPDSDGDGVPDGVDMCPNDPGHRENHGCPLDPNEDPDGDGTINVHDMCPYEPGPPENGGCPNPEGRPEQHVMVESGVVGFNECLVTTQKVLEGPVFTRVEEHDEFGNPTGEWHEVISEIETITVISACHDRHKSNDRPKTTHVHSSVETFIVQCTKSPDLRRAHCETHRQGWQQPQALHAADAPVTDEAQGVADSGG